MLPGFSEPGSRLPSQPSLHESSAPLACSDILDLCVPLAKDLVEGYGSVGLSIGVLKEGKVEFRNVGCRNLAKGDGAPDEETVYLISSMTKPFVATALCMLVHEDVISLDDSIDDILGRKVSHGRQLRVKDLLNHTTPWYRSDRLWEGPYGNINIQKPEEIINLLAELPPNPLYDEAPAGSRNYTNIAFALIAYILEKKGRMYWSEFLHDMFDALNMTRSTADMRSRSPKDDNVAGSHSAQIGMRKPYDVSYEVKEDRVAFEAFLRTTRDRPAIGVSIKPSRVTHGTCIGAAAGICSSVADILKFGRRWNELWRNPEEAENRIDNGIVTAQQNMRKLVEAKPTCGYAIGWNTVMVPWTEDCRPPGADGENFARLQQAAKLDGCKEVWPFLRDRIVPEMLVMHHGGNMVGATSCMIMIPAQNLTVVVLGNARGFSVDGPNLLAMYLADCLLYNRNAAEAKRLSMRVTKLANRCKALYELLAYKYDAKLSANYDARCASPGNYRGCIGRYSYAKLVITIMGSEVQRCLVFRGPGASYSLPLRVKRGQTVEKGVIMTLAFRMKSNHQAGLGGKHWLNLDKTELKFQGWDGEKYQAVEWNFEDMGAESCLWQRST